MWSNEEDWKGGGKRKDSVTEKREKVCLNERLGIGGGGEGIDVTAAPHWP